MTNPDPIDPDLVYDPATLRTTSPGKFEGEPRWVPYFYEIGLDGGTYRVRGAYSSIYICAADEALYPELHGSYAVNLVEDENGFVYGTLLPEPPTEEYFR